MTARSCESMKARFEPIRVADGRLRERKQKRAPYVDCSGAADVAVYALDSDLGRDLLGVGDESGVCDGAIWCDRRRLLVFVELKSGWLEKADGQLASALRAWRRHGCAVSECAVVIMSGSAPNDEAKQVKRFAKRHKCRLRILHGRKGKVRRNKRHDPSSRRVLCTELLEQ